MHELGKLYFKTYHNITIDDKINELFIEMYINDWNCNTIFFNNIYEFIKDISGKYRISILSNTHYPNLIYKNLEKMKIKEFFYKIYTSVELLIRKPNREIFEYVLKDLCLSEKNTIFVGDSYNDDYIGAKSVKMDCYLIDKPGKHPELNEYRLNNLFELGKRIL